MPTLPQIEFPEELPVCARRADIAAALSAHAVVIVCGETGSGKTTQLPKIAWAAGRGQVPGGARIGVTQPRRIAAKSVAQRLAEETCTRLGEFIGWRVRFTDQAGPESRIKVMTDGILLAETQSDPDFRAYDTIILDEAHERSLNIDFLLGYLKTLLPRRPDLKLIVSSATLEAERFSAYFGGAPVIEVSGRTYPVEVRWRPPAVRGAAREGEACPVEDAIDPEAALLNAVDELAREGPGDILVFLPGEREIREAQEALRKHHPPGTEVLPLFARLSVAEQERIFQPHSGRRIVLATNVAETSLTVPGIRYVVDTGLARVKRYSTRSRIEQLRTEKISQAAARQRAGRCGRVAEGICIRLYDEADFMARPAHTTPELLRSSLAGVILRMKSLHLPDIAEFPFLDPPEPRRVSDGLALLRELDALDEAGRLTQIGHELARLPLDPRIGRMLIAARERGVLAEVLVIAAYLSVQDPRERPLDRQEAADQTHRRYADENSDFTAVLRLWARVDALNAQRKSQRKFRDDLRDAFLSPNRVREWRDVHGQLAAQVREMGWRVNELSISDCAEGDQDPARSSRYAPLHQALLSGLLGNVGMLTEAGDYLGLRGIRFLPFPGSGVRKKPKWVMAAEIVETRRIYARSLARIEPEWIEHAGRALLKVSYSDPHWEKRSAHVVATMRATLYGLPVVSGRRVHYGPIDPAHARALFIRALVEGEYASRGDFFRHNARLREEIDAEAHRARDMRLTVDEEDLYRFYDARIPADICTGAGFERWLRGAEAQSPRLLHMQREDLTRERGADPDAYPKAIDLNGARFALAYRFDPGADDDGVTLLVPLAALNQVPQARCEWLVPGMLEEKLAALIRTLPQSQRRAFVPVPDFARAAAATLTPDDRPLIEALAEFLARRTGQIVPRDAWRPEDLPPYLHMNFRVLDDRNGVIDEGRDLAELRRRHGKAASLTLRTVAAEWERAGIVDWDFGDLPEQMVLRRGAQSVAAYPCLVDAGGQIVLRLVDSPAIARREHRRGVCRLLWKVFPELTRQTEKELAARLKGAAMQYGLLDEGLGLDVLLADVLVAAARALLPGDPAGLRSQGAFGAAAASTRPKLAESAREMARLAAECVERGHRMRQALEGPLPSAEAGADMRFQLAALIQPGFMAEFPPQRIVHLPRYLRAMERRLERLACHPARDAQAMQSMRPLLAAWQARYRREAEVGGISAAMEDFRWRLEELRVSLFAQELKTPEPVSVKRLEKLWADLTR